MDENYQDWGGFFSWTVCKYTRKYLTGVVWWWWCGGGCGGVGGAISLVRQLGDRQVGTPPPVILINLVTSIQNLWDLTGLQKSTAMEFSPSQVDNHHFSRRMACGKEPEPCWNSGYKMTIIWSILCNMYIIWSILCNMYIILCLNLTKTNSPHQIWCYWTSATCWPTLQPIKVFQLSLWIGNLWTC